MPLRPDVLRDRRFWAALYCGAFGQIAEPPPPAAFCSLLAVDEQGALDWYHQFTAWHPGIFDESDGHNDDPAIVCLALANDVQLRIEFHPGDQYWFLRGEDGEEPLLANIGPHWVLPGLRWQEAVAIGDAAPREGWAAVLLLLPVVWLTADDDVRAARRAAESAWVASNLVDASSASALAELWASAVIGGRDYRWRRGSGDWVCDAEWSTRSNQRLAGESVLVNRLIAAACGAA
jgi:hypothetical protein